MSKPKGPPPTSAGAASGGVSEDEHTIKFQAVMLEHRAERIARLEALVDTRDATITSLLKERLAYEKPVMYQRVRGPQ